MAWRVEKLSVQSSTISAVPTSVSSASPDSRACSGTMSISGLIAVQGLFAGFRLGHADAGLGMQDLALQVGEVDRVVIDQRDLPIPAEAR